MARRIALSLLLVVLVACDGEASGPAADAGRADTDGGTIPDDAGVPATDAGGTATDGGGGGADAGTTVEPGPRFVGRYEEMLDGTVRFGWPGTGLVVRFRGTGVHVTMDDPAGFFTVVVDGAPSGEVETAPGMLTYDIATGLEDAEHTVGLYRRTEGFFGPTTVSDVSVDGELLGVPEPERSMEVVGDSITCGYGVLGPDQYCGFSADTESQFHAWGAITARRVGAELSTIAWSGKGMVDNYGDDTFEPIPELYDRVIPTEPASWGFERFPDVVVVDVGTNDFSTDGDPTMAEFVGTYVDFLAHVRGVYPDALILCTVAPLLGGDDETRAVSYVQAAVDARRMAGDDAVQWVDLRTAAVGWGCDWHPSVETQHAMSDLLVATLEAELGW